MNIDHIENRLHNPPDEFTREGGGAQAEPYAGVRRASIRQRNPRTGPGPARSPEPASENETIASFPQSRPMPPEAEDPCQAGRGSRWPLVSVITEENPHEGEDEPEETGVWITPSHEENEARRHHDGPKLGKRIGSLNIRGKTYATGPAKGKDKIGSILNKTEVPKPPFLMHTRDDK